MRQAIIFASIALLLGCKPQVSILPATTPQENAPPTIVFSVDRIAGTPAVKLFPRYNSTHITRLDSLLAVLSDNKYQVTLPALSAGEYRLVIDVPYTERFAGIRLAHREITLAYDFTVHEKLADNCFSFDSKADALSGWSTQGVYIANLEKPVIDGNCPGLFYVNQSWPFPLNETVAGGSLFVPVANNCFPKPGQQVAEDTRWSFSLLSPDLSQNDAWQNIRSVTLRMASKSIKVQVSPEIFYRINNKDSSTSYQKTAPHYTLSSGQWQLINHALELPEHARVTQLKIHVSGITGQTVSEQVDSIFLDGVCPVQ